VEIGRFRAAALAVVFPLAACTGMPNSLATASGRSTFDVRAYGALGDGRADDSHAIRAAFSAASLAGGGEIYFPPGTYSIDPAAGPFIVSSHETIAGSGTRSILRVRDESGPYDLIFGQPAHRIEDVSFLRFRVDQNFAGNRNANINPTTDAEDVIQLYDFDGVTIDGVAFDPEIGIQGIVLAGPHAVSAGVVRSTFRFHRGASSNPFYDNSSVYAEAARVVVSGNHFASTNDQNAVTAIEIHGGPGIDVHDNDALEFQIGVNVVNSTKGFPDVDAAHAVISDNRFLETTQAFDLWSVTGRVLRDVTIDRNLVTMEQHRQYANTWLGVSFVRGPKSEGIDGGFERIVVDGNVFDFRPLRREKIATLAAIGVDAAPEGPLRQLEVAGNRIVASPATGVRIGMASMTPQLRDVEVTDNTVSDAGWDPHAAARSRAAVLMERAWMTNVHVDGNAILDTGRFGDLRRAFSAWARPLALSRNVTLRDDRILPHGVMRFSVDTRVVDDRGTRP
jgi:hypothetical protein